MFPARAIIQILSSNPRMIALIAALLIYATLSSPTPDRVGAVEAFIGLCLIIACVPAFWSRIKTVATTRNLWQSAGLCLCLYGFIMAPLVAIIHGQSWQNAARDIIPFAYMLLPLFVMDVFYNNPKRGRIITAVAVFMGVAFAARSIVKTINIMGVELVAAEELYYLANSPLVLFASCLGIYGAFKYITEPLRLKTVLQAFACGLIALTGLAAMALTLQRASIAALCLCGLVIACIYIYKSPKKSLILLAIAIILSAPFLPDALIIIEALMQKTQTYGLNNRAQEWAAVWREASNSWGTLMLGNGWGATFESPAATGARVNFTHSLLSSMLLKTGIAGLILTLFYLAGLMQMLLSIANRHMIIASAIAAPLLIDVLLYGAYKSLDFGILLLLIPVTLLSRCAINTECKDVQSPS